MLAADARVSRDNLEVHVIAALGVLVEYGDGQRVGVAVVFCRIGGHEQNTHSRTGVPCQETLQGAVVQQTKTARGTSGRQMASTSPIGSIGIHSS